MTTLLFILLAFFMGIVLMHQYGLFENERITLAKEVNTLLEALGRQIALAGRVPDLLYLESELSVLASYGFFLTLRTTGDLSLSLARTLPEMPLPTCAKLRLSEYAEQFGQSDREGEKRALRQLCSELSPMLKEEIDAAALRVRTFRVVTIALLLSMAILFC